MYECIMPECIKTFYKKIVSLVFFYQQEINMSFESILDKKIGYLYWFHNQNLLARHFPGHNIF